ncbi:type IV conjugative transfer system protein TraV [Arsenophonus sp. ENCA]|uniref:type IV conjugative transfer system lipoprotein TraV n=1 Tax=Arsenophonus sp. ENCA TaxID=1987579 RepID=UPI000BD35120|nr:type IV conjugative transfer system lipoprotein TraV [Arsenophonus sp. ENCA]PAV07924.1 type IV conjugative transfer system protein TraV [Arsenophonus sp. ENCA]
MKHVHPLTIVLGISLLSGCAGTQSDFQCNATTSDSCMTMEQANDKAKGYAESHPIKSAALSLPTLAEGDFRAQAALKNTASALPKPRWLTPTAPSATRLTLTAVKPAVSASTPLRTIDQTARLWIAPYIDNQDVYHHAGWVEFVVTASHWGTSRVD